MVYGIKNNNNEYFIGFNKWDKQLRKAKLYTSMKWANEVKDDLKLRFSEMDLKIIEVVIYEKEN